jgi:hypothetical protein
MLRWSCAVALTAALSACVVNPHHGQNVGPRSTPITFEIFATKANAALSVTCSSHYGSPTTIASFTGGSDPITYAAETVYAKKRTITIPTACWESWSGSGYSFITYIRVKQDDSYAVVFDATGLDCLYEAIGDGTGPVTAGFDCKREGPDILLYATY